MVMVRGVWGDSPRVRALGSMLARKGLRTQVRGALEGLREQLEGSDLSLAHVSLQDVAWGLELAEGRAEERRVAARGMQAAEPLGGANATTATYCDH